MVSVALKLCSLLPDCGPVSVLSHGVGQVIIFLVLLTLVLAILSFYTLVVAFPFFLTPLDFLFVLVLYVYVFAVVFGCEQTGNGKVAVFKDID